MELIKTRILRLILHGTTVQAFIHNLLLLLQSDNKAKHRRWTLPPAGAIRAKAAGERRPSDYFPIYYILYLLNTWVILLVFFYRSSGKTLKSRLQSNTQAPEPRQAPITLI